SFVSIPMFSKDRAIGGISLAFNQERSFDTEDRALMLNIAQQCAQALERARLHDSKMAARNSLQVSEAKFRRLIESNVIGVVFGGAALQAETWVSFVVDLTEDRRLREQLLRAQKLESLSVLAGGIAHDFNNLMTGVIGNASLAREIAPPGDVRNMLDNIIKSGLQASHLTRQMLAYAGMGRLSMKPVDLAQLVREM